MIYSKVSRRLVVNLARADFADDEEFIMFRKHLSTDKYSKAFFLLSKYCQAFYREDNLMAIRIHEELDELYITISFHGQIDTYRILNQRAAIWEEVDIPLYPKKTATKSGRCKSIW